MGAGSAAENFESNGRRPGCEAAGSAPSREREGGGRRGRGLLKFPIPRMLIVNFEGAGQGAGIKSKHASIRRANQIAITKIGSICWRRGLEVVGGGGEGCHERVSGKAGPGQPPASPGGHRPCKEVWQSRMGNERLSRSRAGAVASSMRGLLRQEKGNSLGRSAGFEGLGHRERV